jgi:hypothetical protein
VEVKKYLFTHPLQGTVPFTFLLCLLAFINSLFLFLSFFPFFFFFFSYSFYCYSLCFLVPNVYPVDLFEHMWAADRLQRLGISRYFRPEIKECINYVYRYIHIKREEKIFFKEYYY